MANASAVPLGEGVAIATGLNTGLGYLLDVNQATYNITSGSAWHLLYIKAERQGVVEAVGTEWEFEMQSKPVADVAAMFTAGNAPRFVDASGIQVRPLLNESPDRPKPGFETEIKPSTFLQTSQRVRVEGLVEAYEYIILQVTELQHQLTLLQEVGIHIFPIAYHRINGNNADIVQCARSDFHFWPVPTLPIWSRMDNVLAIDTGTCAPE